MPHDYAADVEPVEIECPTCGHVRRIDAADEPEQPAASPEIAAQPSNVIPANYIDPATLPPLQRETWPEKGQL